MKQQEPHYCGCIDGMSFEGRQPPGTQDTIDQKFMAQMMKAIRTESSKERYRMVFQRRMGIVKVLFVVDSDGMLPEQQIIVEAGSRNQELDETILEILRNGSPFKGVKGAS